VVPVPSDRPSSDWRDLPVGARVVVRRRLAPDDDARSATGHHLWTDVIGVLTAVDDDGLAVRPDRAPGLPEVRVAAADVEAAKRVPPRPPRRGAART